MIKQPNMKMIGIFITMGALALVAVFGYFLKSKFSSNETEVVMYFNESVKGLDVGSPVLFKGVKIGEVTNVQLDVNLNNMKFLTPVYAKIYNGKKLITGTNNEKETLSIFIDHGLRAQLSINSVITGQLLVELDMYPQTPIILHEEADEMNEIPTINSPFAEISKTLKVMPVAKIAQDVHHITHALNKELPPLLSKMNSTLTIVDEILIQNKNNTAKMVEELGNAAQNVGGAAKAFDLLVDENAGNISTMINSFNLAAQSLQNLIDYLQMYPNAIITGKEY
ncbi:MAG: MCE family protein [Alphaproteobacteria bacterium]|nr:MCE family protein [Alphaproteobacteria bacterium]